MAVREVIQIDEDKCDGCGLCVPACAEGAIQIVDGKAKLISDSYCDGLGDCIGECPQDAITTVEREAADFNEIAVERHLAQLEKEKHQNERPSSPPPACPGSRMQALRTGPGPKPAENPAESVQSQLGHWPVQLMLVPPGAPFLRNADILICADCVPFAVPDFHSRYLAGKAVLVACPKLDDLPFYREKLKAIFEQAAPGSITVLKMEVPCCTGIAIAAQEARDFACPDVPFKVETIGIRGGSVTEQLPTRNRIA